MGRILAIFTASMILGAAVIIGLRDTYRFMMAVPWEKYYPPPALKGPVSPMVLPKRPQHPKMVDLDSIRAKRRRGLKVSELRRLKLSEESEAREAAPKKTAKKRKKRRKKKRRFIKPRMQFMATGLAGGSSPGTSPGAASAFDSGPAPSRAPARQAAPQRTYVQPAPPRAPAPRQRRMRSYGAAGSVVLPDEQPAEEEYYEDDGYEEE